LAIIVDIEPAISDQTGSRVMFHVGGIAALTFLLQSTTAAKVVELLGVTKKSMVRQRMIIQFEKKMSEECNGALQEQLTSRADDCRFSGANVEIVRAMVPALQENHGGTDDEPLESADVAVSSASSGVDREKQQRESSEMALIRIYREVHLRVVQHHYWQAIEEGILPRSDKVTRILLHSTNEALDTAGICLNDWQVIARQLDPHRPSGLMSFMGDIVDRRPFSWIAEFKRTFNPEFRMMRNIYVALCFQEAHAHARMTVPHFFGTGTALDVKVQEQVAYESQVECRRAAELLEQVPAEQVELGKSEMLSRKLLQVQMEEIDSLLAKGLLKQSEADYLEYQVTTAMRKIVHSPKTSWLEAM
jgi:hypothetical protein